MHSGNLAYDGMSCLDGPCQNLQEQARTNKLANSVGEDFHRITGRFNLLD
jgi:hypothetical protein